MSGPDLDRIHAILGPARAAGRRTLLEPEGLALLEAAGIATPRWHLVAGPDDVTEDLLADLPGDRVVVKVVAPAIAHKTDIGGVAIVGRTRPEVAAVMATMRARVAEATGFLVAAFVPHETGPGGELLLSLRWTDEAGPVVAVGAGGIHTEALAADLRPGREIAIVSPSLTRGPDEIAAAIAPVTAVRLATTVQRGQPPVTGISVLAEVVERLAGLAPLVPAELLEIEVNPAAVTPDGLVALDVLVTLGDGPPVVRPPRPIAKVASLLVPRSIAVVGVSSGMNSGRVILRNILRDGFDPARITVVKPGVSELDGVRCVPDLASMPEPVDLFVIVLPAASTPAFVTEVVERGLAHSLIVIPGGLEEKEGGGELAARMRDVLWASRSRPDGGPVVNGGNCLGIRSRPGHYDTLFIPQVKLPPGTIPSPIALVTGSGAFAITRLSRLAPLDPRYVITIGNQTDLTAGDFLAHLGEDPAIRVIGVYVEGFTRLDGLRFMEAAARVTAEGRAVVLYRAGRTAAGASASAGHTAAIAGDAVVTRELARAAGVVLADTPAAFDDLVRTFALLDGRPARGRLLGAISNAGSECVTIADHAGSLDLRPFAPATEAALAAVLGPVGVANVVDIHNPLDLTPIGDDAIDAASVQIVLEADEVDVGIVGIVPMADTIQTLPAGPGHGEDLARQGAIADRLAALWRTTTKPWVVVVDAGEIYDPFVARLRSLGLPVLATADAATRVLDAWCDLSLRSAPRR